MTMPKMFVFVFFGLVGCVLSGLVPEATDVVNLPESVRRRLPYYHKSNDGSKQALIMPLNRIKSSRHLGISTNSTKRRRLSNYISGVMTIGGHKIATQEEGTDYYFATLMLGTPPKPFDLIIDTGSTLAYLPCEHTCTHCGRHTHGPLTKTSTSYKELDCHSNYCASGVTRLSCSAKTCSYSKSYLEGSSVSGLLVQDLLTLVGPDGEENQRPVVFGCTQRETRLIYSQDADGVMGIGREPISIPSQLVDNKVIDDIFSMCMAERRDGRHDGHMVFGGGTAAGNGAEETIWVPMKRPGSGHTHRTSWYIVTMESMSVGGKTLDTPPSAWNSSSYGGAVIDTGTTDMMLPRRLFDLFNSAIKNHLATKGDFHSYYDRIEGNMCFKGTSSTVWEELFPDFSITFGNGKFLQLFAFNYVLDVNRSTRCLSVFTNSGGVILGSNTLLNVLLVFDRKNWRMGFAPSTCNGPESYGNALASPTSRLLVTSDDDASSTLETDESSKSRGPKFIIGISLLSIFVIVFVVWYFKFRGSSGDSYQPLDVSDPDRTATGLEMTSQERRSLVARRGESTYAV